jgi:hypothetical protein
MRMMLELVSDASNWMNAVGLAELLPYGMTERRSGQDPWRIQTDRPRRISDDLAWLRAAYDEPFEHGLTPVEDDQAAKWEFSSDAGILERFNRLQARGILDSAGFRVHVH